jgi:MFS family permease
MRTVLRRPDFRLLFSGLVASMIGESVLLLALAIWVKDLTGSSSAAGATILAIVAPTVLAPVIGWVVDRFRRRPFLVVANLLTAAALSPLFAVQDRDDVWIIYVVAVLYGLSFIAILAALNGLIKEVVPADLLADANGALQTVKQGLRLGGPLLGAGLYASLGGWMLAVVGAAGFIIAAAAIAAMRVAEVRPEPGELHWLGEVVAGVRQVASHPALRRMTLGVAFAVLLVGFSETIFFAYVDEGLHRPPAFVGVLVSIQGIGGLLGGLCAAWIVRRLGEIGAAALGVAAFGLPGLVLAFPNLITAVPAMILAGFGLSPAIVGFNTLMQRVTPAHLLGRTSAAAEALISAPQALSIGAGAVLVSFVDYRLLFVAMAVFVTAAAVYLWAGRGLAPPHLDVEVVAETPDADARPGPDSEAVVA